MIEERIKIHDRFQFEIKFTYKIGEKHGPTKYNVDTYIFIPLSLGVHSGTYSKTDFYNDIQTYLRLKTPSVLLKNIYTGNDCPISKLRLSIEKLSCERAESVYDEFEYRLKMFCSIYKSSLRDELNFITKQSHAKDTKQLIENYIEHSSQIAKDFRNLKKNINIPFIPKKCINLFLYADEYISFLLNESFHELYGFIEVSDIKKDDNLKEKVLKDAKDEISYRKDSGYLSVPSDQSDNEILIFRRSTLKKIIGRILFLTSRTAKEGAFMEQTLFGVAAAFAMAFATTVAFFSKVKLQELTFAFFMILVIAYVFKDRMKDWLKNYFSVIIQNHFYDHKTHVFSNLGDKIGIMREDISFISEKHIPKNIMEIRDRDFLSGFDENYMGERVMLYKKQIILFSERFKNIFPDFVINGINDIIRIDVSRFLSKMDNPEEDVFIPKKSEYITVKGSRVYHINLITKVILESGNILTSKFRIILNRNGIKRIEEIGKNT